MAKINMSLAKKGGAGAVAAAIIAGIFAVEGGWVDNPKDPGGETNHGVTIAVAQQHMTELVQQGWNGKMKDLTKDMATSIYYKDYIDKPGYLPLIQLSPALGEEVVDSGVNAGPGRSSLWFQKSLNALNRGGRDYPSIEEDGRLGPASIAAYRSLVRVRGRVDACKMMIKLMDAYQIQHYLSLKNMTMFTPGWINHRIGNVPLEKCNDTVY